MILGKVFMNFTDNGEIFFDRNPKYFKYIHKAILQDLFEFKDQFFISNY